MRFGRLAGIVTGGVHRLPRATLPRRPRRFHAYCLGMPKSGTHSIESILAKQYRTAHEPEHGEVIRAILASEHGRMSDSKFRSFVSEQDKRLWLEMNASHLNYFLMAPLLELSPQSKYILLIRDCYSWIDSFINHQLTRPAEPLWHELRELRFGSLSVSFAPEERILEEHALYTLNAYFGHWAKYIDDVIQKVPAERLLVIKLNELSQSIPRVAAFLGVPEATLDSSGHHVFKAPRRVKILTHMDPDFVERKAQMHCGRLMRKYFPNVNSIRDALR